MSQNKLRMWFDIRPHPQERIRISFRGGRAKAYYPEKTVEFQSDIRSMVRDYMDRFNVPEFPKDVPLEVTMTFYLAKPKSAKREWPTVRPDLSNYIKSLEDGLQRQSKNDVPALLEDDSSICRITATKRYITDGDPGILIEIGEMTDDGRIDQNDSESGESN